MIDAADIAFQILQSVFVVLAAPLQKRSGE